MSSNTFDTYCKLDTSQRLNLPPDDGDDTQRKMVPKPYGPFNCDMYSTLKKPGVNPLTLRGKSTNYTCTNDPIKCNAGSADGINYEPVIDDKICYESNIFGCNVKVGLCSKEYTTNSCNSSAPGGLADFMGEPNGWTRAGKNMKDSYFAQIWANAPTSKYYSLNGLNGTGYKNPIEIGRPDLMKNGFVMDGCECDHQTENISKVSQNYPGGGLYLSNVLDAGIKAEVWNGDNTYCNYWNGNSDFDIAGPRNTCGYTIEKYAQTCDWCKSASFKINHSDLFPSKTKSHAPTEDIYGKIPCECDSSGKDKGDCFGIGPNGKPRVPCNCSTKTCPTINVIWKT
jgi:hypothetical protein